MSTLAELITRIRIDLNDASAAIWSDNMLTTAIRAALYDLNAILPRRIAADIDTVADAREYALAYTGFMEVLDVWYPHNPADPTTPPTRPAWTTPTRTTLRIEDGDDPTGAATEHIHILYSAEHTIDDLDSAAVTTLTARQEQLLALGAAGYAALQASMATVNTVTASTWTTRNYADWGQARLSTYRQQLADEARREHASRDARLTWDELDDDDRVEHGWDTL